MTPAEAARAAARFLEACDLHDAGVEMMRERLRREDPGASRRVIEARLTAWLRTRPGAEFGDGEGTPRR